MAEQFWQHTHCTAKPIWVIHARPAPSRGENPAKRKR